MEKHKKAVRVAVAFIGNTGVEVVENGLGGFYTISIENSWEMDVFNYMEKLETMLNKFGNSGKYWIEAYSSSEILVGLV
jgi:hypothetical protein